MFEFQLFQELERSQLATFAGNNLIIAPIPNTQMYSEDLRYIVHSKKDSTNSFEYF